MPPGEERGRSAPAGEDPQPVFAKFYIESDGKVYTIEEEGRLTLPGPNHHLPFDFEVVDELDLRGTRIAVGRPQLEKHPHDWIEKDDIPYREHVDPVLQAAVNRSLTRGIANAAVVRDDKVLLVQGSRGMTKGMWHFPGGFISMGEAPEDCVLREIREEVGLTIRVTDLLAVYRFKTALSYYIQGFFYTAEVVGDQEPHPDPDEIAAFRWDPIEEAAERINKRFASEPLAKRFGPTRASGR